MHNLKDKVALVVGGAGYLGSSICKKLAENGASVVVADANEERGERVAGNIAAALPGSKVKPVLLDVGNEESVKEAVERTVSTFGGLDILVNAAFHSTAKRLEDLTSEEFDAALHVNVTSAFMLAREAARAMSNGGSIVMFASMYGLVAPDPKLYSPPMNPNPVEYGASKAAVIQMTRYLAVYWAPGKVRVNAVAPGPFPNPDASKSHPDFVGRLARRTPLGRIGNADEVADAVLFLSSDEASYITGQTLVVDGGWTIW